MGSYFRDRLSAEDREAVLTGLQRIALMRSDQASPPAVLRDSEDDYLMALALDANAEAIVTGDCDLLGPRARGIPTLADADSAAGEGPPAPRAPDESGSHPVSKEAPHEL